MKAFFKSDFWKTFGSGLVMSVIALGVFVGALIARNVWNNRLTDMEQQAVVDQGQQAIQENTSSLVNDDENEIRVSVTGMNGHRKESDDAMMKDVFSLATNWSGSAEYMKNRERLMDRYEWATEDTWFMTNFFPALVLQDSAGNPMTSWVDTEGLNMSFAALYTDVVAIQDGTYSYIGELLTQSRGPNGAGAQVGRAFVSYDTAEDGTVSNLQLWLVN